MIKLVRIEFAGWKVLRGIDGTEQGGLNITGAGIYQEVQKLNKYERGFLVSKSTVFRASMHLKQEARKLIDFKLVEITGQAHRAQYKDFGKFVVETLIAYGLGEKAQLREGVEWGWTSDGANFTRDRGHTTSGGRPLDIDAVFPGTEVRIFDDGLDLCGRQLLKNYHISDVCNPCLSSECRETDNYYQNNVRYVFDFLIEAETSGILYQGRTYYIRSSFPADMSCHWKVTGRGGAAKNILCSATVVPPVHPKILRHTYRVKKCVNGVQVKGMTNVIVIL
jgi:hypothetical protein